METVEWAWIGVIAALSVLVLGLVGHMMELSERLRASENRANQMKTVLKAIQPIAEGILTQQDSVMTKYVINRLLAEIRALTDE